MYAQEDLLGLGHFLQRGGKLLRSDTGVVEVVLANCSVDEDFGGVLRGCRVADGKPR